MRDAMAQLLINEDARMEVSNIATGTFRPLSGFMGATDYHHVVDSMHLTHGEPWTLPITLDVPEDRIDEILRANHVALVVSEGEPPVAILEVEDVFKIEPESDAHKVFGTVDPGHPGVRKELARSRFRVGGTLSDIQASIKPFPEFDLSPAETKRQFEENGWKKIVGFQTRNPPHRAHEYLQRIALEISDGLFIQPLIGWKKPGDFTPRAIMDAYQVMVDRIYPRSRVLLGTLRTPMRYAGPREAVFHALLRKNHGCTHFIIGRDHAGVGAFYGKYEAQDLALSFADLGIEILPLAGPRFCSICDAIVTERSCAHGEEHIDEVSGTSIRSILSAGQLPPDRVMRNEVATRLVALAKQNELFNEES